MRTFAEMKAAVEAHNEARDMNFLERIVEDVNAEMDAKRKRETDGRNSAADEAGNPDTVRVTLGDRDPS